MNPSKVLAEVASPFSAEAIAPAATQVLQGDFKGDGQQGLVLVHSALEGHEVAVLDSETLETQAHYNFASDGTVVFSVRCAVFDIDGNETDELLCAVSQDPGTSFEVWQVAAEGLTLLARQPTAYPCAFWDFMSGDVNGDRISDVSIAWHGECEAYPAHDPPEIFTFLGGAGLSDGLEPVLSPQPRGLDEAAAGDFDGDGDFEVVLAENVRTLRLFDWRDGGLVETGQVLDAGEYELDDFATLRAGRFSPAEADGLLISVLHRVQQGSVLHAFGAIFPSATTSELIELPRRISRVGSQDSDLNGDGIADFFAATDEDFGLYVSRFDQWVGQPD